MAKELTSKEENYSQWYNDIVTKAELAENSSVRGCMVIKPYGYAIWENIQHILDGMFKKTGHSNAYFPLLIPKSFFNKEANHVKGFAKECAVVTHYRLKNSPDGKELIVDENAKLEEELIVRPTSETIIWNTYKNWIQSYHDLPILINQWANIVRWEMHTRLFLRTSEFLWQEGHTAHATKEEAIEETNKIINIYSEFAEKFLAIPVIIGTKSDSEKFAGAIDTYCIESLMQDGKALQAGTSHFLGQNFAKAFDVKFSNKEGKLDYVWATSWGVSTRLIGALIMAHSDNNGLVLPPKIAPVQVVIIPIYKNTEEFNKVVSYCKEIKEKLENIGLTVKPDYRDTQTPGWKFSEYELKGIPVRIAIGPRDIKNKTIEIARRDTLIKTTISTENICEYVLNLLTEIQENIFNKALKFREQHTYQVNNYNEFKIAVENGGFFKAYWDGTPETEAKIKEETKATIRCIPLNLSNEEGFCMVTGKPSKKQVIFARAY